MNILPIIIIIMVIDLCMSPAFAAGKNHNPNAYSIKEVKDEIPAL